MNLLIGFLLAEQPDAGGGGSILSMLALPVILLVLMWFVLILPNRRQEKQRLAQLASLKKNDTVINSGGIIGVVDVIKKDEDEIVLRGGLRITKSSVQRVVHPEDTSKTS
ncbi:MAG TPA: preprotein translocase subunit YajC [Gemmataceae bacterium]|nr:preprotein translocase subunit YajC [Gemmataceae bacterium]